jgi:hypothetical protein
MLYLLALFALASAVSAEPTTSVNFVFANMLSGAAAPATVVTPPVVEPVDPSLTLKVQPKYLLWTYGSYGLPRRLRYEIGTGNMNFQGESGHVMSYSNPFNPWQLYDGFYPRRHDAGWWWCGMNEFYGPNFGTLARSFGAFSSHQYIYLHATTVIKASSWPMSIYDGPGADTAAFDGLTGQKTMARDGNSYIIPLKPKNGAVIWVSKPNAPFAEVGPGFLNDETNVGYFQVDAKKEGTGFMIWDKRHNIEYMVVMHDMIKDEIEDWRMNNMADGTVPFPQHDDDRWKVSSYGNVADPDKNTFPARGYRDPQLSAGVRVSIDWDMDLPLTDILDLTRAFAWVDSRPYVGYDQEQHVDNVAI